MQFLQKPPFVFGHFYFKILKKQKLMRPNALITDAFRGCGKKYFSLFLKNIFILLADI